MKVMIAATGHAFLLYILIIKDWERTYFIFSPSFDKNIVKKLKKNDVLCCRIIESNNSNILKKYIENFFKKIQIRINYLFIIAIKFVLNKKIELYGQDHIEEARLFLGDFFCVVEDGIASYLGKDRVQKLSKNFVGNDYLILGYDESVPKIYLTGILQIPKEISHKAHLVNIKKIWKSKEEFEQKKILDLFGVDFQYFKQILIGEILLITQNFSECGYMKEEEKIQLYQKILSNYDISRVTIKKHPLENTDYGKFFPGVSIIKENIPLELFVLMEVKIEKVVTINSTAIYFFGKSVKNDFYDLHGNKRTQSESLGFDI